MKITAAVCAAQTIIKLIIKGYNKIISIINENYGLRRGGDGSVWGPESILNVLTTGYIYLCIYIYIYYMTPVRLARAEMVARRSRRG